jgi:hypothetical protein
VLIVCLFFRVSHIKDFIEKYQGSQRSPPFSLATALPSLRLLDDTHPGRSRFTECCNHLETQKDYWTFQKTFIVLIFKKQSRNFGEKWLGVDMQKQEKEVRFTGLLVWVLSKNNYVRKVTWLQTIHTHDISHSYTIFKQQVFI